MDYLARNIIEASRDIATLEIPQQKCSIFHGIHQVRLQQPMKFNSKYVSGCH